MLRSALANIHGDPHWWRKILIGGALMLTLVGYPLAVGLVTESMENSRKGFPTPLPPWYDWSTRYLIGLFSVLIDFVFFIVPLLVAALLVFCAGLGAVAAGVDDAQALQLILGGIGGVTLLVWLALFFCSVAPVARLLFVAEGRIEDALSRAPLRQALTPPARRVFLRARLLSLAAYLPAALLGSLIALLSRLAFPGALLVLALLAWLALSALLYAHLVVVQLYVAADKELARTRIHS